MEVTERKRRGPQENVRKIGSVSSTNYVLILVPRGLDFWSAKIADQTNRSLWGLSEDEETTEAGKSLKHAVKLKTEQAAENDKSKGIVLIYSVHLPRMSF